MEKLTKYTKHILIAILVIAGVFTIIFGKNDIVQGGITCICWGVAVLTITWIGYNKNHQELIDFDNEANWILQDIAINGPESEYYQFYNIEIINKARAKLVKKHKKQVMGCTVLGAGLLLLSIICFI